MFVKVTPRKKKNKTYYYAELVESYREDGKIKHKRLLYFGSVTKEMADKLKLAFSNDIKSLIDVDKLILESSTSYGNYYLINEISRQLKLLEKFTKEFKQLNSHLSIEMAVKCIMIMVYSRIVNPNSKLFLSENYKNTSIKNFENMPDSIDIQTIYRSLEVLESNFPIVEKYLYELSLNRFNQDKEELFYDITSSYFEGHKCVIAEYGYSRDHRRDKEQLVIGLVITKDGFPVKCNIYKGNTVDKTTVEQIVSELTKKYNIEEIVFVGDRGMLTSDNVKAIEDLNQKYVMAIPRQWTKKYLQDIDINPSNMVKMDENLYGYSIMDSGANTRQLLCLNTAKKQDDEEYRFSLITKITASIDEVNEKLNNTRTKIKTRDDLVKKAAVLAKKNPAGKYINLEIVEESANISGYKISYSIDNQKLEEDKRLDGTFLIQSNVDAKKYTNEELLKVYKNLSKVENAFKIIKNDLDIRPMYHWKEERVKGHIYICIIAYFIINAIEYTLQNNNLNLSARKALQKLDDIHLVKMLLPTGDYNYKITAISQEQKEILNTFKIKKIKLPK